MLPAKRPTSRQTKHKNTFITAVAYRNECLLCYLLRPRRLYQSPSNAYFVTGNRLNVFLFTCEAAIYDNDSAPFKKTSPRSSLEEVWVCGLLVGEFIYEIFPLKWWPWRCRAKSPGGGPGPGPDPTPPPMWTRPSPRGALLQHHTVLQHETHRVVTLDFPLDSTQEPEQVRLHSLYFWFCRKVLLGSVNHQKQQTVCSLRWMKCSWTVY